MAIWQRQAARLGLEAGGTKDQLIARILGDSGPVGAGAVGPSACPAPEGAAGPSAASSSEGARAPPAQGPPVPAESLAAGAAAAAVVSPLEADLPLPPDEEERGPSKKVLARRVSHVEDSEDPVAAAIAKLSDSRRDELVVRELREHDLPRFSELLRAAVEKLGGGGDGGEVSEVHYPRSSARGSPVWVHSRGFYLLRGSPGKAFCKICCPLSPDGKTPSARDRWVLSGIKDYRFGNTRTHVASVLI